MLAGLETVGCLTVYTFSYRHEGSIALDMGSGEGRGKLEEAQSFLRLSGPGFGDPFSITVPDPCLDEERWRTIGKPSPDFPVLLFVVHTWPSDDEEDPAGRIIS